MHIKLYTFPWLHPLYLRLCPLSHSSFILKGSTCLHLSSFIILFLTCSIWGVQLALLNFIYPFFAPFGLNWQCLCNNCQFWYNTFKNFLSLPYILQNSHHQTKQSSKYLFWNHPMSILTSTDMAEGIHESHTPNHFLKSFSSYTLDLLSRAHFPNSESPNSDVFAVWIG